MPLVRRSPSWLGVGMGCEPLLSPAGGSGESLRPCSRPSNQSPSWAFLCLECSSSPPLSSSPFPSLSFSGLPLASQIRAPLSLAVDLCGRLSLLFWESFLCVSFLFLFYECIISSSPSPDTQPLNTGYFRTVVSLCWLWSPTAEASPQVPAPGGGARFLHFLVRHP